MQFAPFRANSIRTLFGAFFGVVFIYVILLAWKPFSLATDSHSSAMSLGMIILTVEARVDISAHLAKKSLQLRLSL